MIHAISNRRRSAFVIMLLAAGLGAATPLGGCDGGADDGAAAVSTPEPDVARSTPTAAAPPAARAADRSNVAQNPAGWPPVEFEPRELDFGILGPGETGSGSGRVWNVGSQPLSIIRSITSCGCTTTEDLGGRTIPPGGFIDFATSMEPKSGNGEKKEKVTFFFRGYEQVQVPFFFKAELSQPVRVVPPRITAYDGRRKQTIYSGEVTVTAQDGSPFRLLASHGAPPAFIDFDPAVDAPRAAYRVRWDITAMERAGNVPWFWVFETDRPDSPVVDIRVQHDSTRPQRNRSRPWQPKDQRVVIGEAWPGTPVDVEAKIEFNPNVVPDAATASISGSPDGMDVQLTKVVRDGQFLKYKLRVTVDDGEPGLLYGLIDLNAAGFSTPLRVIGRRAE
jgi:hypothetical protein